jgi:DNA modification methylase
VPDQNALATIDTTPGVRFLTSDPELFVVPDEAVDGLASDGGAGPVDGKQAELFRIHAGQDWSGIRDDDLPISDTWVVVRDNNAYHTVHRFHPYFAMCPPPIARRAIEQFSRPGDLVADPFCGAGVTLVEARIAGRASVGIDVLSIARYITKVKTTLVDITMDDAMEIADRADELFTSRGLKVNLSAIYNVDYWFLEHSQRQLAAMLAAADTEPDEDKRDFYRLAASCVVRPVSKAGNLESHLHVKAGKSIPDGLRLFRLRLMDMVARERDFSRLVAQPVAPTSVHSGDSRDLTRLIADESVDFVFTSPPYGTGTKYASVYRLQMQLLGLEKIPGALETKKDFLGELRKCLSEINRMLKRGGKLALLYGTNRHFSSRDIAELSESVGLTLEDTIACPVIDESKMVRGDYKRSMANEHLIILSKPT